MIINHNLSSVFANRQFQETGMNIDDSIEKLSSGLRINRAGDDASGLAVSEKMRTQVNGLFQAMRNTEDGMSFLQTAEGYLDETTEILQRMRELVIQGGNGIYSTEDRMMINVELSQLVDEVNRIASQGQFNGMTLFTGTFSVNMAETNPEENSGIWFHIGANMDQREQAFLGTMTAEALAIVDANGETLVSAASMDEANQSIGVIDLALDKVVSQRADLGAYQNRFEKMYKGLYVAYENTMAAESRIRDTDMASQMSEFVKDQILAQANVSMLAQANLKPQLVLRLLG